MKFVVSLEDRVEQVEVIEADGSYRLTIGDQTWVVDARLTAEGIYSLLIDGVSYAVDVTDEEGVCTVHVGAAAWAMRVEEATRHALRTSAGAGAAHGGQTLTAPLPGKITHVAVKPGDRVQRGDTLLVIEAMKMENEFRASAAGTVAQVRVHSGQAVNAGDVLVVIES